jgi:hypothetical protein
VLIPSTDQSGQKLTKAVTSAIAATIKAPALNAVLNGATIPIMISTMPITIRMALSVLPTLHFILSPFLHTFSYKSNRF